MGGHRMDENLKKLATLHRYWIVADSIKLFVGMTVPDRNGHSHIMAIPDLNKINPEGVSGFYRLSVWYALLYVVVEAYEQMKLSDTAIDALLQDRKLVDLLRCARNATFHFQDDFFTPKFWDFYLAENSERWVQDLHRAFDLFFVQNVVKKAAELGLKMEDPFTI
jgi:hypothetical protein